MITLISHTVPQGYTALGEAFELACGDQGHADTEAVSLVPHHEFDQWAEKNGLGTGWRHADPIAEEVRSAGRQCTERRMRQAMANGKLDTFVANPLTGAIERILDREAWEQPAVFWGLGITTYVDPLVNPGPQVGGRPVFLLTSQFEAWRRAQKTTAKPFKALIEPSEKAVSRKIGKNEAKNAFLEMARAYPEGSRRPTVEQEQAALRELGVSVTRDRVRAFRHEHAPAKRGAPNKSAKKIGGK